MATNSRARGIPAVAFMARSFHATAPAPAGIQVGDRVRTWDGCIGRVTYVTSDWVGVRIDADGKVWEYQQSQLEAVVS